MKMTSEDYQLIKDGISSLLKQNSMTYLEARLAMQRQYPNVKDITKATMWRLFNKAEIQGGTGLSFCCQILYRYLEDSHINTALDAMANELS